MQITTSMSMVLKLATRLGSLLLVNGRLAPKCLLYCSFFFFSSRRRHTRFDCDWSSDVCSSDLVVPITVDTSSSGFYFVAGQHYTIDVQTDKYYLGGFQVAYPPESLVQTGYTIGYDTGQANATVLNIWLANRGNASATLSAVTLQDSMSNSSPITFPMNGPTISKPGGWVERSEERRVGKE